MSFYYFILCLIFLCVIFIVNLKLLVDDKKSFSFSLMPIRLETVPKRDVISVGKVSTEKGRAAVCLSVSLPVKIKREKTGSKVHCSERGRGGGVVPKRGKRYRRPVSTPLGPKDALHSPATMGSTAVPRL